VRQRFRVKDDLNVQRLGAEIMVFDQVRDEVHVLNETSAAIWEGVREGLDAGAIEQRLRQIYNLEATLDVGGVIRTALEVMAGKGILVPEVPSGADFTGEK